MGFEEARSRLMLRARGLSRHLGVRSKLKMQCNAMLKNSVGVSGGKANPRPTRRSQGLGGGVVRVHPASWKFVSQGGKRLGYPSGLDLWALATAVTDISC